jgi:glycosyltransferase involved in cell wall biosynthesis
LLGWQPDAVIRDHLRRCKALLFPGEEDFGIVPLEAQGCGAPVIALGRGGATETVVPPETGQPATGILYSDSTEQGLINGILQFESLDERFDPAVARKHAVKFNTARFERELLQYLATLIR